MGEHEGVLNAQIHASRRYWRVNVSGIAGQHHAADRFARGDAVTDMKYGLPSMRSTAT